MNLDLAEWLSLALRWLHLTAGIAWIGSSFYFVWLDNHLKSPVTGESSGELWSVHGGGFYHNQKYQVAPAQMPGELHWFKWEAYFTWISGFSLLVLIYYFGAETYLIDLSKARLDTSDATMLGLATIAVGWGFYHLLCLSPIGKRSYLFGAIWFAFLVAIAAFLDSVFNAKAAYLHVGALIGTVMVANVFVVIIPNQRKVVADLVRGKQSDAKLGQQAKQRSVHNNYMTLPVLFMMISQHYPMTYGAQRPWLVLALIGLTGLAVRHVFNLRHRGKQSNLLFATIAALVLASVGYVGWEKSSRSGGKLVERVDPATKPQDFAPAQAIIAKHCQSCHSRQPTDAAFSEPPVGLALDNYQDAKIAAAKIQQRAVETDSMPLGNMTGMTPQERATLGAWVAAGAPE